MAGGGVEEKDKHVPPGSFARRLHSTPTLVPRFGIDSAAVSVAGTSVTEIDCVEASWKTCISNMADV